MSESDCCEIIVLIEEPQQVEIEIPTCGEAETHEFHAENYLRVGAFFLAEDEFTFGE